MRINIKGDEQTSVLLFTEVQDNFGTALLTRGWQ